MSDSFGEVFFTCFDFVLQEGSSMLEGSCGGYEEEKLVGLDFLCFRAGIGCGCGGEQTDLTVEGD